MDNCRRFIKSLEEEKLSPATIRLRITAIERFSRWMKKPIELNRPKIKRKLDVNNVPTEEEYNRLLEYLKKKIIRITIFLLRFWVQRVPVCQNSSSSRGKTSYPGSDIKRKG